VGAGKGILTDDSSRWHLTVIGSESECKSVTDDLATSPALAPYKDKLLVQSYRPGNWATAPVKLENGGKPDIVLQLPPDGKGYGKVILRLAGYPGAAPFAEAIRKADPNYDPSKDPPKKPVQPPTTPSTPDGPNQPLITAWKPDPMHICLGGATVVLALLTLFRKKG
jgi:hypothetical protein